MDVCFGISGEINNAWDATGSGGQRSWRGAEIPGSASPERFRAGELQPSSNSPARGQRSQA